MTDFDEAFDAQLPNEIPIPGQDRMAFLENKFQYLYAEVFHLRGVANQPCYQRGLPLGQITHNWVSDSKQRVVRSTT